MAHKDKNEKAKFTSKILERAKGQTEHLELAKFVKFKEIKDFKKGMTTGDLSGKCKEIYEALSESGKFLIRIREGWIEIAR